MSNEQSKIQVDGVLQEITKILTTAKEHATRNETVDMEKCIRWALIWARDFNLNIGTQIHAVREAVPFGTSLDISLSAAIAC